MGDTHDEVESRETPLIPDPAVRDGGCLIVGVGASAGGMEAFQRVLRHMPRHDRIALVYVQHLDPTHESLLPDLLAREARMPVQSVQDESRVAPGQVYVIPPNTSLTLHDGVLRLGPRLSHDVGKPIDTFMASLAEDQGERAVAVVLSGTGSDGAAGLRAIKERGGVAIAQLPESAAYDSMPRAAIASGLVDYILPPEQMPARLVDLASRVGNDGDLTSALAHDSDPAVTTVCEILHHRTGHDFSSYKRNTLVRRIGRRMDALHAKSLAEYVQRLRQDEGEAQHLFQDMLIGVTSFFRDPDAFHALAQWVLPGLFEGKSERDQVRVWTVGCASGEEAYSLAILLAEEAARSRTPPPPKVQIFATDLDEETLVTARRGRYPEVTCNSVPAEQLQRHFTREDGGCRIRKEIRQMCLFSKHSLLHDPPFPELDLISCRNLLIYLDTRIQQKVIALFHHALRAGGVLFLGAAENIAGRTDLFEPVERGQRIYRRKDVTVRQHVEFPLTTVTSSSHVATGGIAASAAAPEAALRRSVERAVLDEYVPPGMVVRPDGDIVYVFGPTAKCLGPSAGAPSLNALPLVRKRLRADLRRALERAVRTGEPVAVASQADGPGGHREATQVIVRPFTEVDAGRLFVVVFQDVQPADSPIAAAEGVPAADDMTVRRLQSELRDTREQLQATIDDVEAANQELQSSNEELLSMNEELQSSNEELQSSKEEVQTVNAELESVNRELSHKVEELDTAKSDLESLFEGAQLATVFLDGNLLIKRFTPTATEVFRLRAGDVGRPVADITARFTDGDMEAEIRDVLRSLQRQEVTVTRANDGTRYLMRILPYRTRQNLIDGVVVTFVNVTELKRAQEALERANDDLERRVAERTAALEEANRRKDDFLAMLSHELRNPLAAIRSSIDVWRTQDLADPRVSRARELAGRQVDHITRLLGDLLDTARIVRGTVELRREPLDLATVLEDAVDAAAPDCARRHQEVRLSVPADPLPVHGDPARLEQVFFNLLSNAQKFTPQGGHIDVSAVVTDGKISVRVRDDGTGIPPELLPHIFESFVQGHQGPARPHGGLGLGLTVVWQLVNLHGGTVEARSAGEGAGTEFLVTLPLATATAEPAGVGPADPEAPRTGQTLKRVLIVDDNSDAAELLGLLLKMEGQEVRVVHDGPAALEAAREFRPDIVLLDLGLPGMDGYEVARRLRESGALPRNAAVVAVTGYGRDEDRQRSREAGFDGHLVKPVDADTIKRALVQFPSSGSPER